MIQDFIRTVPDYPIKGVNFYDLNSLFAGPMFKTVIGLLLDKATAMKTPTHIIGVESRGFVLGSAVAYALGLPFVMVRKKGAKYPGKLLKESYELEYGKATLVLQEGLLGHTDRCIIVDDFGRKIEHEYSLHYFGKKKFGNTQRLLVLILLNIF